MTGTENVLLVHGGGLGDLVLAADLLCSLRSAWPHARMTLACRDPFVGISSLMPEPPDRTVGLGLHPYLHDSTSEELIAEVRALVESLAEPHPDLLIAGSHQATWLDWFLAASLKPGRCVGVLPQSAPRGLLTCLLSEFGLDAHGFDGPEAGAFDHEKGRYAGIIQTLGANPVEAPPWTLPKKAEARATEFLSNLDLSPGQYLACFPSGEPRLKCWPVARFGEVLAAGREEYGLRILLLGDRSEEVGLAEFACSLPGAQVFAGGPEDLSLLAGLLAMSRAWFGVDSGPMHLAQAYRVPGVAVFGGGTSPAYAPWAEGVIGIAHRLPCFGCYWDCAFGHPICVESVPVEPVRAALRVVLTSPPCEPELRNLDLLPAESLSLISDASSQYRAARRESRHRHQLLLEIEREALKRERGMHELTGAAERLAAELNRTPVKVLLRVIGPRKQAADR